MTWIKPPALRKGDTIGVVAPSSGINMEMLEAGCIELKQLGFKVRYREDIHSTFRYLAGRVDRRVEEFREMLLDAGVAAIFCARGGYGSAHLLDHLSLEEIREHPKILCGVSDITMLLNAFSLAGVVAFHGPMVAGSLSKGSVGYDEGVLRKMLVEGEIVRFPTKGTEIVCEGEAEGRLQGGCLSLLVSTLGTAWEMDTSDSILLLEDMNVKPYQIDRMLTQLRQAGKFEGVRGIIFGEMLGCVQHPDQGYTLTDILRDCFSNDGIPVLCGFASGHTSRPNLVVPFGVRTRLALGPQFEFEMLEPAVQNV